MTVGTQRRREELIAKAIRGGGEFTRTGKWDAGEVGEVEGSFF
jgi:hypothetical protein